MKTRFLILLLATLCFSTAWSADRIGNTPWHLVDYWWDFGKDTEFESYEVDFSLSNDVDPRVRLYIAPIGLGHFNKVAFYGPRIPLTSIPKITVTFEAWRINGKATPPQSALAYYPRNVPQYVESKVEGKQVIGTIGKNVDRNQAKGTSKQGGRWVQRLY